MAHLYFLLTEPGQIDRVLIWDTRTLSIGRSSENDLTVDDEEISRKHAMLVNEGGSLEIGDYRTGNGSFVNGQRVREKQEIRPGDVIGIGKLKLELCLADEHPAGLGLKLDYASQLKTVGMVPEGADAGSTMLGLADTAPPADDFVVEPERATGEQAFMVGADSFDEFQLREFDDGLDQIDLDLGDALELDDPVDSVEPSEPQPLRADPNSQSAPGADPTERLRKIKLLHDEGLITDEEFQAKRSQILKEM
jgi:hypothetical protein